MEFSTKYLQTSLISAKNLNYKKSISDFLEYMDKMYENF